MAKSETPESVVVYALKVSKAVMDYMRGKALVKLALPEVFARGDRLMMTEWVGGPTGRVDLCRIVALEGFETVLARSWCWAQGKLDQDLKFLGLTVTTAETAAPAIAPVLAAVVGPEAVRY